MTRRAPALAIAFALMVGAEARASSVEELLAIGKSREASGDVHVALRNYMDALRLDPTSEPGYLALGALREKMGDVREAERTYAVAIEHIPGATAPFLALARLWWKVGREEDGSELLRRLGETRATDALVVLAEHFEQNASFMRALVTWRRIGSLARVRSELHLAKTAEANTKTLLRFVHDLDPVTSPSRPTGPRTTLSR